MDPCPVREKWHQESQTGCHCLHISMCMGEENRGGRVQDWFFPKLNGVSWSIQHPDGKALCSSEILSLLFTGCVSCLDYDEHYILTFPNGYGRQVELYPFPLISWQQNLLFLKLHPSFLSSELAALPALLVLQVYPHSALGGTRRRMQHQLFQNWL